MSAWVGCSCRLWMGRRTSIGYFLAFGAVESLDIIDEAD